MEKRNDAQLTADVLAQLKRNTFLEPLAIDVFVDGGVVTLKGSIDSELNRWTAEAEARNVPGVKDVINLLTLMGAEARSNARADSDIQHDVEHEIASDPTLENPDRFHVRVRFGQVIVSGPAESLEEEESVIAAAQRVPGVEAVDDRLDVHVPIIGEQREEG